MIKWSKSHKTLNNIWIKTKLKQIKFENKMHGNDRNEVSHFFYELERMINLCEDHHKNLIF